MELKYLIIGTGRCGTVFMARLLTSLGIPCGHESVFDWRGIELAVKRINGESLPELSHTSSIIWENGKTVPESEWLTDMTSLKADSSYLAVPFLAEEVLKDVSLIHVVRNPVKVIHSFCHHIDYFASSKPKNGYEEFIYSHIPELTEEMPQYDRACLYYIKWNEMIEKSSPAFFHRVEDGPKPIMDFLGVYSEKVYSNTKVNTYQKWSENQFYIHSIQDKNIRDAFVEMGRRYKYPMSEFLFI